MCCEYVVCFVAADLESAAREERGVGVDFLRGNTGLGESFRPKFDELLDDLFPLEVQVPRRVFATEAAVEQRAISEILARLEILPDHGLRADNHAREQLRPFALAATDSRPPGSPCR